MSKLILSEIQKVATHTIYIGLKKKRAALLQLPTGFGKSLIAVKIFEKLQEQNIKLRLVIVLPKQNIPDGWYYALGFDKSFKPKMFKWFKIPYMNGKAHMRFETHRSLTQALFLRRKGRPPAFATELNSRKNLIVIDEIHRYRKFVNIMSAIFLNSFDQYVDESALTKPFRAPSRGRHRHWPKWLLLSATPYNPVSLDLIDPLDSVGQPFKDQDENDEIILVNEIQAILGTLAYLSGFVRDEWFDNHIEKARDCLSDGHNSEFLQSPKELMIWPELVKQEQALRPTDERRKHIGRTKIDNELVERAFQELIVTTRAFQKFTRKGIHLRSTAERFVLAGGFFNVRGNKINGYEYSRNLAISVNIAVSAYRKLKTELSTKLDTLLHFIESVRCEHVLVFCVHRAVASAVASVLKTEIGDKSVRTAIGGINKDEDKDWFNGDDSLKSSVIRETRVLVATDACSESIDLHLKSNILVHYELPWSPLRVLQRVGRLWRIRPNEIEQNGPPLTPKLPGIVHFAHPGSVDEEILSRLHRRWGHLSALGLDYLSYEEALGIRLPTVAWTSGNDQ